MPVRPSRPLPTPPRPSASAALFFVASSASSWVVLPPRKTSLRSRVVPAEAQATAMATAFAPPSCLPTLPTVPSSSRRLAPCTPLATLLQLAPPAFIKLPPFAPAEPPPLPPFLPTHARPSLAPTRRVVGRLKCGDSKRRLHVRGCQGAECSGCPTAQKIFASVGQKHQYRAGDTLIEQGKPSDQCYYILKVSL